MLKKYRRSYLSKIKANKPVLVTSIDQLKIGRMYKFEYEGINMVNMVLNRFKSNMLLFTSLDTLKNVEILPPWDCRDRAYKIHIYEQKERIKL
jgi:hypothetical protein